MFVPWLFLKKENTEFIIFIKELCVWCAAAFMYTKKSLTHCQENMLWEVFFQKWRCICTNCFPFSLDVSC